MYACTYQHVYIYMYLKPTLCDIHVCIFVICVSVYFSYVCKYMKLYVYTHIQIYIQYIPHTVCPFVCVYLCTDVCTFRIAHSFTFEIVYGCWFFLAYAHESSSSQTLYDVHHLNVRGWLYTHLFSEIHSKARRQNHVATRV